MLEFCLVAFVVLPLIALLWGMWRMHVAVCYPDEYRRLKEWEAEERARLKERLGDAVKMGAKLVGRDVKK